MASAFWLASEEAPVLRPWTVRSRTLRAASSMFWSVESDCSSQAPPSLMLRASCETLASSVRVCIARLVPVGESDGRIDEPAGGELLLQLPDGVEVAVESLEAGERDRALGDAHSAHRPTRPVRLISTSSVSSIAVIMRPAAA